MTTVNEILEKLTTSTDIIKEVEPTTEKRYNLNKRFIVIREGKEYFISIKSVDVIGQVIKSHVRFEIDTNVPKNTEKKLTRKEKEIMMWQEKLDAAIKANNAALIRNYTFNIKKVRGY